MGGASAETVMAEFAGDLVASRSGACFEANAIPTAASTMTDAMAAIARGVFGRLPNNFRQTFPIIDTRDSQEALDTLDVGDIGRGFGCRPVDLGGDPILSAGVAAIGISGSV
jgi:hypothetical protein